MDSTKITQQALEAGMSKTGPEFYAFMAVCLILGIVGLFLWFQSKQELKKAREAAAPASAPASAPIPVTLDKETLQAVLKPMIDNLELRMGARIESLEKAVEFNREHEEGRLTVLERKVDDGFRTLHDRLDRHIEAHWPPGSQNGPKARG